ncbi:ATP synthase subunit I [Pallidibacillus pasinlerensis]|uniref:ATP synthase subunit I n=1 Tax=Pallidibacillus pasinlerensis TaxID=2703818 RepID=A0ABW9ZYP4_9BACI|nr:ATP synthase subunit I [Pallidibacillus pasinlerensis]NCU16294.1 ATP synthase subunit I [Pallidibacillus pasinlerensis]
MPDIGYLFKKYRQYLFYFLALLVLGWGFTPYKTIFLGLILGTTVSFINLWLLYKKTIKFSEAILNGKKAYSLGMLSRFAYAGLAILIAIKFPNYFNIIATVIGLLASTGVIFGEYFLMFITKRNQEER